jgi:hypothetical protein
MDTLLSLRNEVLGWLDEVGDSGTTADNVDNAIRQAHTQRVTEERWGFMLYPKQTLTLTASLSSYSLHTEFHRPLYFFNTTKKDFLVQVPPRSFTDPDIDFVDGQDGKTFTLWGMAPVAKQPTSTLSLVSTSAADTGSSKAIIIRGETASGVETETLTPSGTTPVAGTKTFTTILNVTLTGAWAGTLTLSSASITLLTLTAGELGRQYQQLRLLWSPSSADSIEYQFFRKPSPLTNDYDIPDIPFPHAKILVWDALLLMAAYDNQVEGGRLGVWLDNQRRMDLALRQAYLEPQSLRSRGRFVKYTGD